MRYTYSLLAFAAFAVTALALPTEKPADNGNGSLKNMKRGKMMGPGKYEGKGTGHNDGKWTPTKYPGDKSKTKRDKVDAIDDDSRKPGKYESQGTNFEDAKLTSEKYGKRSDDGSWRPGKYEGDCTGHDDGKWTPEKYD
ncbi:hypothetical protein Forpe1208_v013613 [Fusarium oxysporum f. sp. rapae]|uniref:Uncharacterized protein n=1 Tax=Fusarium oxysporum f. sp. rapae TaxID=485398 RepID=A0A8J5NMJ6_FUSOX|nr:hypothetical protein Forpe1208_v013613 [Fusarium oxysporum f. sp. rapae]